MHHDESPEHSAAKIGLCEFLCSIGLDAQSEFAVPSRVPGYSRRLDVGIPELKLGFEIERSPNRSRAKWKAAELTAQGWQIVHLPIKAVRRRRLSVSR